MAGGSTDAAATMIAMNALYKLGLSKEALMQQALQLGADIPFCILGGLRWRKGLERSLRHFQHRQQQRFLLLSRRLWYRPSGFMKIFKSTN